MSKFQKGMAFVGICLAISILNSFHEMQVREEAKQKALEKEKKAEDARAAVAQAAAKNGLTIEQVDRRTVLISEIEALNREGRFEEVFEKLKGEKELKGFDELNKQIKSQIVKAQEGLNAPSISELERTKITEKLDKLIEEVDEIRNSMNLSRAISQLDKINKIPDLSRYSSLDEKKKNAFQMYDVLTNRLKTEPGRLLDELKEEQSRNPEKYLNLKIINWEVSGFGTVGIVSFQIRNKSRLFLKDPSIKCTFYGASGTPLTRASRTAYISIPPGGLVKINRLNFGLINSQSETIGCSLEGVS